MLATLHELPVVVLRLMMTYGPGQKAYKVVPATILSLLKNRPINLASGSRLVNWVYIDDVTEAFMRAAVCPYPGAASIDIGTGELVSVRDCLQTIGHLTGRPHLLRFGALPDRALEMTVRPADGERAARLLDWRPSTTLRAGLARTEESMVKLDVGKTPLGRIPIHPNARWRAATGRARHKRSTALEPGRAARQR